MKMFKGYIKSILAFSLLSLTSQLWALTSQTLSQSTFPPLYPGNTILPAPTTTGTSTTTPINWVGSGGCSGSGSRAVNSTNTGATITNNLVMNANPTSLCTLYFSRAADSAYSFSYLYKYMKVAQTISVTTPPPASIAANVPFNVAATASSGLAVTIAVSGGCTINSGVVTMTGSSEYCIVSFSQPGNSTYTATSTTQMTVELSTITRQIQYFWVDGNTGKIRFATTVPPMSSVACLSNWGYFLTASASDLAVLLDAKLNDRYVNITFTPRTDPCSPTDTDHDENQLASVSKVEISTLPASHVTPSLAATSLAVNNGSPFSMLNGISLGSFVVNGSDGKVRTLPTSMFANDYCNGFIFGGTTDVGQKFFTILSAVKVKVAQGGVAPITIWYYANTQSCGTGDQGLTAASHIGLMY